MTEKIINKWLEETKTDLVKNYKRLGLKASGDWAKSLKEFDKKTSTGRKFGIQGNDYTQYLELGRRPNKNQNPEYLKRWVGWAGSTFLKKWVEDKRLNISPFAVAWKIAREGTKVPNKNNAGGLVSDVVTTKRINELNKELSYYYISEFKSDIIKNLKDGSN